MAPPYESSHVCMEPGRREARIVGAAKIVKVNEERILWNTRCRWGARSLLLLHIQLALLQQCPKGVLELLGIETAHPVHAQDRRVNNEQIRVANLDGKFFTLRIGTEFGLPS